MDQTVTKHQIDSLTFTLLPSAEPFTPCDPNPCLNDGWCEERLWQDDGYHCYCFPDFYGDNCEFMITTTSTSEPGMEGVGFCKY